MSSTFIFYSKQQNATQKLFLIIYSLSFKHELDPTTTPVIMCTKTVNVVWMPKSLGINDLLHFDFIDAPPAHALILELELLFALVGLNDCGELTKFGRRMALGERRRELDNKGLKKKKIVVQKVRSLKLIFVRRRIC